MVDENLDTLWRDFLAGGEQYLSHPASAMRPDAVDCRFFWIAIAADIWRDKQAGE